jgi:hypothetical protein
MSSKEKVLAIRSEAVCCFNGGWFFIRSDATRKRRRISADCFTAEEAWAAAYKYLTK